jgi:D-lactate dehydrogenase (cytochrome)
MMRSDETDAALLRNLASIVGDAHVTTDEAERRYFSRDFFYWDDAGTAAIVAAPGSAEEVQALIRLLAGTGREIAVRGGGMSTGRSYVPQGNAAILLDMQRLNRIREINPTDRYLVAEAGCTWQQVVDALAAHKMVCDFTIPGSGSVATVGGAMAHNVTGGMKGVLGIEAVRANGDLIRTGSWAREAAPAPYWRDYGPDLTGLFLGDTGAFGIKTAISLHISPLPEASAFASFAFDTERDLTLAMLALSNCDYLSMRSGFDPTLTRIVMEAQTGAAAPLTSDWTLHLRCDQLNEAAAEAGILRARNICLGFGREISRTMAAGLGARRLSVRGCLSRAGDRWIATNAVFPLSRAAEATEKLRAFLDAHGAEFLAHDVKVANFVTANPYHYQLEPLFWWRDTVSELALRHIDPAEAEQFRLIPENPANRAFITHKRHELRDLFERLGALHVHTSKFFRYAELLSPGTRRLLQDIKHTLDPETMFNPGNLGLKGDVS